MFSIKKHFAIRRAPAAGLRRHAPLGVPEGPEAPCWDRSHLGSSRRLVADHIQESWNFECTCECSRRRRIYTKIRGPSRENFCRACHLPVLHACERCTGPGEPWRCWQCGLLRHLAVTTTLGAEHWVCASCGAAEAQPRRSRRGRRAPPSAARPPRPGRQGSAHQVRPTRGRSRGAPAARHAAPRRSKSRRKRRAAAGRPLGSRDRQPTAAPAGPATPRRRPGQARPAPSSAHAWGRPGASPLRAPMIEESDAASQSRALAQRDSLQNKTSLILSERLKSIINKRLIYNSRRGLFRRSRRASEKSKTTSTALQLRSQQLANGK